MAFHYFRFQCREDSKVEGVEANEEQGCYKNAAFDPHLKTELTWRHLKANRQLRTFFNRICFYLVYRDSSAIFRAMIQFSNLFIFQCWVGAVLYPKALTSQLPSANHHWLRALSTKLAIISEQISKEVLSSYVAWSYKPHFFLTLCWNLWNVFL